DISIEAQESSKPQPVPVPVHIEPAASDPILVEPPLVAKPDRKSDPDRTPLPIAEGDSEEIIFETQPPADEPGAVPLSKTLTASRLDAELSAAVPSLTLT